MFNNIGNKIKKLSIIYTIIGLVISCAVAIVCWANDNVLTGFIVLILGCLVSWIGSFLLYGFGELITQTTNIANSVKNKTNIIPTKLNNAQYKATNTISLEYWICKKCGSKNKSTKMFCRDCGTYK